MRTPKPNLPDLKYCYIVLNATKDIFSIFATQEYADQVVDEQRTMFPDHKISVIKRVIHE